MKSKLLRRMTQATMKQIDKSYTGQVCQAEDCTHLLYQSELAQGMCILCEGKLQPSTGVLCSAGCSRKLVPKELMVGRCVDCVRENTINIMRCNCGKQLHIPMDIAAKQCFTCSKPSKSSCTHTGSPLVFTLGAGTVRAGGMKTQAEWDITGVQLLISLDKQRSPKVIFNKDAEALVSLVDFPNLYPPSFPRISLDWNDGAEPPVPLSFFVDLVKLVQGGMNILVHCVGGHGRTGTALVAMAHVGGIIPDGTDGVKWIRKKYCVNAVETGAQKAWLADIGVKVEKDVEKVYSKWSGWKDDDDDAYAWIHQVGKG